MKRNGTKRNADESNRARRTLAGWRANAIDLKLSAEDLPLIDNVLAVAPILRVVTAIGQEARCRGLKYPVKNVAELQAYMDDQALCYANHRIDRHAVSYAMPESWFPIAHEGELLSRVHMALLRCEAEAAALAPAANIHGNIK